MGVNQTEANLDAAENTEFEMVKHNINGDPIRKKSFNLRGPREGKKSATSKQVDEKKLNLARSLFGRKK